MTVPDACGVVRRKVSRLTHAGTDLGGLGFSAGSPCVPCGVCPAHSSS